MYINAALHFPRDNACRSMPCRCSHCPSTPSNLTTAPPSPRPLRSLSPTSASPSSTQTCSRCGERRRLCTLAPVNGRPSIPHTQHSLIPFPQDTFVPLLSTAARPLSLCPLPLSLPQVNPVDSLFRAPKRDMIITDGPWSRFNAGLMARPPSTTTDGVLAAGTQLGNAAQTRADTRGRRVGGSTGTAVLQHFALTEETSDFFSDDCLRPSAWVPLRLFSCSTRASGCTRT